jgi:hypothetical protein
VRVFFQTEDESDTAVLGVLVRRLLKEPPGFETVHRERRTGGIAAAKATLTPAAWEAWRSGACGLVVVVDNDGRIPRHEACHEPVSGEWAEKGCSYCEVVRLLPDLPERQPLPRLKFVVGVPVQALEAWLLFGADIARRKREPHPEELHRGVLKPQLYGMPSLPRRERRAICLPIAEQVVLADLARACPSFGHFSRAVEALPS